MENPNPDNRQSLETNQPSGASNFYVLLFGGIMLVGMLFLAWLGTPPTASAVGQPLPPLDLQPLANTDQPLTVDELKGKLVVLHFWGTWCPPCIAEFPDFAKLFEEFAGNPEVLVISVSSSQGPEYDLASLKQQTLDFMAGYGVALPTYCDAAAMTRGKLALQLPNGTFSYPTTLLVDRDGTIVEALVGSLPGDMEKLASKIKAML